MSMEDFKKIRTSVPWHKRPQKWWDLLSILGGVAAAAIWFLYGSIRSGMEGFDIISPILMIGIPVVMVMYRQQLDDLLMPLQPHRKKVSKLVLIGLGIAVPFLTAWILYNIFVIRNYPLMQYNMVVGTFAAYAITREPILGKGYRPPVKPNLKVPLFLLLLSWVVMRAVRADHCLSDPLNAQDCLRSSGYAETIAGTTSAGVSTAINAPEIARNLIQTPPSPPPDTGTEPPTTHTYNWAQTPEERIEEDRQNAEKAADSARILQEGEERKAELRAKEHEGMIQDPVTGDWVTPSWAREVAKEDARERAEVALPQDRVRRLEEMRELLLYGPHVFDQSRSDVMLRSIDRMLEQQRSGQDINVEEFNRLRSAYGNDVMGNTIPPNKMPPPGENWNEILTNTVETSAKEIFTGKDADGKTSYSSGVLRFAVGLATGGASEWVYTPASSLYDMKEYVDKGGNSAIEAFRESAGKAVIDEATGRVVEGLLHVGKHAGLKVLEHLAEHYPDEADFVFDKLVTVKNFLTKERHIFSGDATRAASSTGEDVARVASSSEERAGRAATEQAEGAGRASEITEGTVKPKNPEIEKLKNEIYQRKENLRLERENAQQLSSSMETTKPNLSVDEVSRRGITLHEQQVLKTVGREEGAIIDVRGREPVAAKLIEKKLALPKGPDIHAKTVKQSEIDKLGYDPSTKDLAVCRMPDPIPATKPPDMSARQWRDLRTAHAQRTSEFINEGPRLQKLVDDGKITWDKTGTGIIRDKATGLPHTSDIDGFMVRDAADPTKLAPPEVQKRVVERCMKEGLFEHGVHGNLDISHYSPDVTPGSLPGAVSERASMTNIDHRIIDACRTKDPSKGLLSFNGPSDTVNVVRYTGFTRNRHGIPN